MKRCPECRRDYYDDTLIFCLDDGTRLIDGPANTGSVTASESPTRHFEPSDTDRSIAASNKNFIIAGIIGIIVVTSLGVGSYLYYGRNDLRQIDSIAVMPFTNDSGNPEFEYLSDGMTETLIASLSRLPNLNVKARSSVFRYKGKDASPQTVGKELNVQAILNGRVVQRGQDLILNVELIDARTENVLWTENYSRKMANLVPLQNDIARDVAEKLKVKLSGADEQKLAKNYTENAEAYQLYLKGRFHWYKRTQKDFEKSAEYFRQAIALDPDYALAYTGLADVYAPTGGAVNPEPALRLERLAKAREAALKAVSLDDNLAEAHTALGTVLASADYDFAGAEREYHRAIELNPNYADAHYWYGMILNRLGRWEESFAEFQRALELEPFNLVYQTLYGASLAWAGRYEEGINHLEKTRELDENFAPTIGNLANAYQFKGDYDRAIELRARELELSGFAHDAAALRNVYAKGGWEGYLRYVTGDSRPAWVSFYEMALADVQLDERDKAIAALNKSYENREGASQRLKVDPRLDPLRNDPRFQELLKKIGFPQ